MRIRRTAAAVAALLLVAGWVNAQSPEPRIEEAVALDNDAVRTVVLTYPPGADSGIHINLGPEMTLVQEGEITLYTAKGGKEALGPGVVHWLPAGTTHLARNEGSRPARFFSVLLKRCE